MMDVTERRIIIFDDDEDILAICTYILEEQGWTVTTFTTCNDVIERVDAVRPAVILMDNWIPDEGGIIATRKLKMDSQFNTIPVVYFSANRDIHLLAVQAGADGYLAKPFNLDDLINVINSQVTNL